MMQHQTSHSSAGSSDDDNVSIHQNEIMQILSVYSSYKRQRVKLKPETWLCKCFYLSWGMYLFEWVASKGVK